MTELACKATELAELMTELARLFPELANEIILMRFFFVIIAVAIAFFSACDFFESTDGRLPIEFSEVFDTTVTLAAVGDMMFARGVKAHMDTVGIDAPLRDVGLHLNSFDITTGNLECPVSHLGQPMDKKYVFRADPEILPELAGAGFDVLTVANNHAFDYGLPCFLNTLERLRGAGIEPVGGGKNLAEALEPVYIDRKGKRFGFLAFNDTKTNYIGRERPACAPAYPKWLFEAVRTARDSCDVLVVHIHWGWEYYLYPLDEQIALGHAVVDSGADVVLGHHPHCWEGVEFYNGGLIAYSLGNFIFDQRDFTNNISGILELTFHGDSIAAVAITPVEMLEHPRYPHRARGEIADIFCGYIGEACRQFPTDVKMEGDKIILTKIF